MALEVNGKTIETNEEGFLLNPEDWDEDVMEALIAQHEAAGHRKVTETARGLIGYVREFYEENQRHPTMHELVNDLGRHKGESFRDAEEYKKFLYELFPHGPEMMLAKLAGLPEPREANVG